MDELVCRVAAGDREAFVQVYEAVVRPVMGLATAVVKDPAQAEEVAQEVLVEVWRTAPRFRPDRGSALNWVLTLTHRRAVDRVRSAQARSDRERRAALRDWSTPYDEVAEEAGRHLDQERVRRCLGALTAPQRECLLLAYYEGLTYREVADALAQPVGTVKARLRQALRRLAECVGAP
ncbi:ECF RNA polymerase sigma factor SigK [Streptomyces sp. NPDC089919]|uniref:ECF RNA polymerase sigma factor SigK n=1 Tax=Streptomyces sp. NPDC089919 TaxID=3155188 RepID=UPI00342067C4